MKVGSYFFFFSYPKMNNFFYFYFFIKQKETLITAKQCEDTKLSEESRRHWHEISIQACVFDRLEKEVSFFFHFDSFSVYCDTCTYLINYFFCYRVC